VEAPPGPPFSMPTSLHRLGAHKQARPPARPKLVCISISDSCMRLAYAARADRGRQAGQPASRSGGVGQPGRAELRVKAGALRQQPGLGGPRFARAGRGKGSKGGCEGGRPALRLHPPLVSSHSQAFHTPPKKNRLIPS